MNKQFTIHPDMSNYQAMFQFIGSIVNQGEYATVSVKQGKQKKRSLSVNALQSVWIKEVSEWSGHTEQYVRSHDKLEFGLPILRAGENEAATAMNWMLKKIGFDEMSPKQQMVIVDQFSVTSIMTTEQHREYRNAVQAFYADAGLILVVR
jgi:hypothetical protein